MSRLRDSLRFFVSFILMFAIVITQLCFFVNARILNGNFYKNILDKSDYYSLMRKDIDYGFKNLSMVTSIPEETFISAVSNEDIIKLSNLNINSTATYMNYRNPYTDNKMDTKKIYEKVQNYVLKSKIKVDGNLTNQLLSVSNDAGNIINNYAVLFNITAVEQYEQFQSFRKLIYLLDSIKILLVIIVLLMIALLVLLNRRRPRRTFSWIGSSLIPAAMMTLIPSILALYFRIPHRFAIDSVYLKVAVRDITMGYIGYFMITGGIVLLLGVSCMLVYSYLSNKAYYAHLES